MAPLVAVAQEVKGRGAFVKMVSPESLLANARPKELCRCPTIEVEYWPLYNHRAMGDCLGRVSGATSKEKFVSRPVEGYRS
jgi:hypothetical protein